jgi:hypothetical protein
LLDLAGHRFSIRYSFEVVFMPTVTCPRCGKVVRFEGVAGVCPSCAAVVRAAKPAPVAAVEVPVRSSGTTPPGRASRKQAEMADLNAVAGGGEEAFDPGVTQYTGHAGHGLDKRLIYAMGGAVGLVLLIGMAVILYNPKPPPSKVVQSGLTPTATPQPVAPTNPDNHLQEPLKPIIEPTTRKGESAKQKPGYANLHPAKPELPLPLITDKQVGDSLKKGVNFLKKQFVNGQLEINGGTDDRISGADALCVEALLYAGTAIDDPDLSVSSSYMKELLDRLKKYDIGPGFATYSHSLRLQALALAGREDDSALRASDLAWLKKAEWNGAWGYTTQQLDDKKVVANPSWDHSNSQYGVLGLWAATDAGLTVEDKYWADIENHWISTQCRDGGWVYHDKDTDISGTTMTCAGITSLCVAAEQQAIIVNKGKRDIHLQMTEAISKGLDWIGKENRIMSFPNHQGYSLYGVERAALATGFRFFGPHDWYRELGAVTISQQYVDGSWGDGIDTVPVECAFRLLFLARGRQPLLLDKLRFDGNWNNRPRDAAKLTQFVSRNMEKTFAWSVADITRDPAEWLESPMLLITTDADPEFSDDDIEKFRRYVDDGGMILLNNEGGKKDVDAFDKLLAARIFPKYRMLPAEPDDLVYTSNFALNRKKPPTIMTVTNGSRVLLVYSPTDIASGWVKAKLTEKTNMDMQTGMNIFVDAAGPNEFRNRLNTPYIDPSVVKPIGTLPIFRIKYDGNWDPEPGAYRRFQRSFQNQTSIEIKLLPVDSSEISKLDPDTGKLVAPIATLTGNSAADLSKLDMVALRNFVQDGGVLLIDSAGGNKEFAAAVNDQLLAKAFPGMQTGVLNADHEILNGSLPLSEKLDRPTFRTRTKQLLADGQLPSIRYLNLDSGMVIVSDLDLTTGLLGTNTFGIFGYTPSYCEAFFKDVALWTLNRNVDPAKPPSTTVPTTP